MSDERVSPCRLFVYLAREAPVGVVLRRGPSDWARLSLWHTDDDWFEHGQWMRARVFERRSDLSPDGSLFVAFVRGSAGPTQGQYRYLGRAQPAAVVHGPRALVRGWDLLHRRLLPGSESALARLGFAAARSGQAPHVAGDDQRATALHRRHERLDRSHCLDEPAAARRLDPARGSRAGDVGARSPNGDQTLAMRIVTNTDFRAYGGRYVIEYAVRTEPERSRGRARPGNLGRLGSARPVDRGARRPPLPLATERPHRDRRPQRPNPRSPTGTRLGHRLAKTQAVGPTF